MAFAPGPIEMGIVMMMSGLFSGSGLMGLPPGDRDAVLAQCAPATSVIYMEWSQRSGGKPGAKGIDGLAADPEIRFFLKSVEKAILASIEKETANASLQERTMAKAIPQIVKILLNRPGCIYADLDPKALANVQPGGIVWVAMLGAAKGTIVVNGGNDAATLAKHIEDLLALLPADARKKGINRQPLPLPLPGTILTLHRHKNYFILGFGKGTVDTAVAGLTGKSKGLLGNAEFVKASKKVAFKRTASVSWIDVKTIVKHATAVFGPQVAGVVKMLGADSLGHVITSTGVVDGQVHTRTFISTGGKTGGILSLASGRAIKPADLAHVPADSDLVFALSLNAPKMFAAIKKIVAAADPGSKALFDELIKQLEEELGLTLEKDLFAAFGDVWVFHDSKSAGGVFLTSLVGSVEVRDPRKAEDVFSKLMDALEEALPGEQRGGFRRRGVFLNKKPFMGQTIFYINTIGDEVPFAPAFCLSGKHLLIAPHPQAIKAHLRYAKGKGATFAGRIGKDVAIPQGEMICFSFLESKRLVRLIYSFAPYFGQVAFSAIQQSGGEIDIFSLPSARAILPYLGNSLSTVVRTKDGILAESRSGAPIVSSGFSLLMMSGIGFYNVRRMEQQFRGGLVPPANIQRKLFWRQPKSKSDFVAFFNFLRSIFSDRKAARVSRLKSAPRSHPATRLKRTLRKTPSPLKSTTGA